MLVTVDMPLIHRESESVQGISVVWLTIISHACSENAFPPDVMSRGACEAYRIERRPPLSTTMWRMQQLCYPFFSRRPRTCNGIGHPNQSLNLISCIPSKTRSSRESLHLRRLVAERTRPNAMKLVVQASQSDRELLMRGVAFAPRLYSYPCSH